MNWIDLLSVAVPLVFFVAGLIKGLIREVMTLAGVVISFFAALHLAGLAAPWVERWVVFPPKISLFIGFLAVFVVFIVVFHILGYLVYKIVRATPLTVVDRLAGGLFGLCKGSLIIFLILLVASFLPFKNPARSQMSDSYAFESARWAAPVFARYLRAAAPAFLRVLRESGQKRLGTDPTPQESL